MGCLSWRGRAEHARRRRRYVATGAAAITSPLSSASCGRRLDMFRSLTRERRVYICCGCAGNAEFGIGGIATRDVSAGDTLASIPYPLVLQPSIAEASPIGIAAAAWRDTVPREDASKLASRAVLYAFMVAQRRDDEGAAAAEADGRIHWGPYLRMLPKLEELAESMPLCWDMERVDEQLGGTNLGPTVLTRQEQLRAMHGAMQEALRAPSAGPAAAMLPADALTWEEFLWAHCAFSSRCFPTTLGTAPGLELAASPVSVAPTAMSTVVTGAGEDEDFESAFPPGCMLPLLDVLNHKYRTPITWFRGTRNLAFRAEQSIKEGEEVFCNYGPKGNEELLIGYGFCLPDNEQDYVTMAVAFDDDPLEEARRRLLRICGLELTHFWRRTGVPLELFKVLRVCVMTDSELYFATDAAMAASVQVEGSAGTNSEDAAEAARATLGHVSDANEFRMLRLLLRLLLGKISSIEVKHDDSPTEVEHMAQGDLFAHMYRKGQREILASAMAALLGQVQALASRHVHNFAIPEGAASRVHLPSGKGAVVHSLARVADAAPARALEGALVSLPDSETVVSTTDLGVGAVAAAFAPTALLTVAVLPSVAPRLAAALGRIQGLDEDTSLAIFLLHELARGPASPWSSVLRAMQPPKGGNGTEESEGDGATATGSRKRKATPASGAPTKRAHQEGSAGKGAGAGSAGRTPSAVRSPVFWSDELSGRDALATAVSACKERREELSQLHGMLFPTLCERCPDVFAEEDYTFPLFLWATALVDACGVSFPLNGTPVRCLLPIAPRPRFSMCPSCEVEFDASSNGLVLRAIAPLRRGDEVTLGYDSLDCDSGELLSRMGVVVPNNPLDTMVFDAMALIEADGADDSDVVSRLDALEALGVTTMHYVRRGTPPLQLLLALQVCDLSGDAASDIATGVNTQKYGGLHTTWEAAVAAGCPGVKRLAGILGPLAQGRAAGGAAAGGAGSGAGGGASDSDARLAEAFECVRQHIVQACMSALA